MKYRITAPVAGFNGTSVGVAFTQGVAEIEAPELPPSESGRELTREERAERERVGQDAGYRQLSYFRSQGYGVEPVDEGEGAPEGDAEPFDPSGHSVEDVLAYLAEADDAERERVLAAERDGKNRKTITEKGAAQ